MTQGTIKKVTDTIVPEDKRSATKSAVSLH